jgi:transmembrane sensor
VTEPVDTELDEILDAAASWHTRLDLGTANKRAFEAWRTADPRHAAAFARMVGTDDAIARVSHRIEGEVDEFDIKSAKQNRRQWLGGAVAGVGAIVLGGGGLFAALNRHAHAETRVGERQSLSLVDGARLEVNTDTKVAWQWDTHTKKIWLKRGEIAVTVIAASDDMSVYALGHEIEPGEAEVNVRIRDNALEVTCLRGTVQIITPALKRDPNVIVEEAPPMQLHEGQAYYSAEKTFDAKILKDDELQSVQAWQSDEMVFTGQPLSAVISDYNRYLSKKIVLKDATLSSLRLGGRFNVHDTADFLAALRDSFGIKAVETANAIELSR